MEGIQMPGVAQITTAVQVGSTSKAVRVFYAAVCSTKGTLDLYNGTSATGNPFISLSINAIDFHSDQGIRFKDGCYAVGTSAIVSYVEEIA